MNLSYFTDFQTRPLGQPDFRDHAAHELFLLRVLGDVARQPAGVMDDDLNPVSVVAQGFEF